MSRGPGVIAANLWSPGKGRFSVLRGFVCRIYYSRSEAFDNSVAYPSISVPSVSLPNSRLPLFPHCLQDQTCLVAQFPTKRPGPPINQDLMFEFSLSHLISQSFPLLSAYNPTITGLDVRATTQSRRSIPPFRSLVLQHPSLLQQSSWIAVPDRVSISFRVLEWFDCSISFGRHRICILFSRN